MNLTRSMFFVTILLLVGCGTAPHVDYNNNNDGGVNDATDNPTSQWVGIDISSGSQLAYWAQDELETPMFELTRTSEDCDGGRPGWYLQMRHNSAIVVSAADDLLIVAEEEVDVFYVRQDPEHVYSHWNYEFLLGEFYDQDPEWVLIRFPTTINQMGGLKRGLAGFICAMEYNMVTMNCQVDFPTEFFVSRGTTVDMTLYEHPDDFGEPFVLIYVL